MLNKETLSQLFHQYYSEMFRLAYALLGNDEDAEDIVQDVFARLMEKGDMPEARKIHAYLMTAVHHCCMNIIRRTSIRQRVEYLYPIDVPTEQPSIDKMTERWDVVLAYAEGFKEPHRSIFHLRFINELTLKEIAQRLDMNPNTVYKYLQQSIQQLRSKINHLNDNRNGHKQ